MNGTVYSEEITMNPEAGKPSNSQNWCAEAKAVSSTN